MGLHIFEVKLCDLNSSVGAKVLSEKKKRKTGLKLFQKQPTLCRFMNKTRQQSLLHSTQKETNHLQTA